MGGELLPSSLPSVERALFFSGSIASIRQVMVPMRLSVQALWAVRRVMVSINRVARWLDRYQRGLKGKAAVARQMVSLAVNSLDLMVKVCRSLLWSIQFFVKEFPVVMRPPLVQAILVARGVLAIVRGARYADRLHRMQSRGVNLAYRNLKKIFYLVRLAKHLFTLASIPLLLLVAWGVLIFPPLTILLLGVIACLEYAGHAIQLTLWSAKKRAKARLSAISLAENQRYQHDPSYP